MGISLGSSSKTISVSYNALKRIEVDRVTVQPKQTGGKCIAKESDFKLFVLSDDEEPEEDTLLLSHLVKLVTDVDLDDSNLATRICDFSASSRKSKSISKIIKARKKVNKLNKNGFT